jgi:antimicrobial peptide system SdpA family protein
MESHVVSPGQLRLLAIALVLITCFWLVLFGYSIHQGMPFNPVNLPLAKALRVKFLLPQGWKFFTRSAREEFIKVFAKDSQGHWQSALAEANASPGNLFGLNRKSRAQGIEIGMFTTPILKEKWADCKERLDICMESIATAASIPNDSPNPTLCGEIVLVRQSPAPWAWSRAGRQVVMPSKCVKVNLLCSQALSN